MARLIDADALLEKINDTAEGLADCDQQNAAWALWKYAVRDIMGEETVDAVEVVRCTHCKNWDKDTWFCNEHSTFGHHGLEWNMFAPNDFCSYGEREDSKEA